MSNQPEALRLAGLLEDECGVDGYVHDEAAAELRRLHVANAELTECLEKKSIAIQRIWKERDELRAEVERLEREVETWKFLYCRAINEANGLTNYVEDRPELYSAEKRLTTIQEDARAALKETK